MTLNTFSLFDLTQVVLSEWVQGKGSLFYYIIIPKRQANNKPVSKNLYLASWLRQQRYLYTKRRRIIKNKIFMIRNCIDGKSICAIIYAALGKKESPTFQDRERPTSLQDIATHHRAKRNCTYFIWFSFSEGWSKTLSNS